MTDLIRHALTWLLLLLLPGTGRHRAGDPFPAAADPYVLKRRRLALVLAADYGIDLDQHVRGAVV